ncbi:hypothetical protein L3Q82_025906 [Scortum barcoo]|uniref:Uncharacterized protein n=1 Tax=Scortum barcoo TaxID=214431 RepID=A0ACB8WM79_9TELE|nr:hypothetical protein L3Q82_025906 [Scortum barcoo]
MRFSSRVVEHWTSSIPSTGCLEGLWEFAQPVHMCFVDLEKAFEPCPSWYSVGECSSEYGVRGPLLRAVRSLYDRSRSLVSHCRQTFSMCWSGLQPSVKLAGMRISTSKSEAMVLDRKRVACPLRVGGEVLPQVEEFKYLGVLFTSEGKMEREIDRRIGAASAVMRSVYRTVRGGEEGAESKGWRSFSIYRSIYVPTLTYGHELWVMTERTRSRIQAAEMSFLRRVAGRSLRDRGGVPGVSHREEALGRPRTRWRDYVSRLAWEHLESPRKSWRKCPGVREVWASLLRLLPQATRSRTKRMKMDGWMDGWMDGCTHCKVHGPMLHNVAACF